MEISEKLTWQRETRQGMENAGAGEGACSSTGWKACATKAQPGAAVPHFQYWGQPFSA
jgi:hypothetical protein